MSMTTTLTPWQQHAVTEATSLVQNSTNIASLGEQLEQTLNPLTYKERQQVSQEVLTHFGQQAQTGAQEMNLAYFEKFSGTYQHPQHKTAAPTRTRRQRGRRPQTTPPNTTPTNTPTNTPTTPTNTNNPQQNRPSFGQWLRGWVNRWTQFAWGAYRSVRSRMRSRWTNQLQNSPTGAQQNPPAGNQQNPWWGQTWVHQPRTNQTRSWFTQRASGAGRYTRNWVRNAWQRTKNWWNRQRNGSQSAAQWPAQPTSPGNTPGNAPHEDLDTSNK